MYIYSVHRYGGSRYYSIDIKVYDTITKKVYSAKCAMSWLEPDDIYIKISNNTNKNKEIYDWLTNKTEEIIRLEENKWDKDQKAYFNAIRDWKGLNGTEFYKGELKVREYKGKIPGTQQGLSNLNHIVDNEYEWVSFDKGAVFGHSKSKDSYFVASNYTNGVVHVAGAWAAWAFYMAESQIFQVAFYLLPK